LEKDVDDALLTAAVHEHDLPAVRRRVEVGR
jgi:hypothetical protein